MPELAEIVTFVIWIVVECEIVIRVSYFFMLRVLVLIEKILPVELSYDLLKGSASSHSMLIVLAVLEVCFRARALLRHKSYRLLGHILVIRHFNPRATLIIQEKLAVNQLIVENHPLIIVLILGLLNISCDLIIFVIIDIFESGSFASWHV